MKLLLTLLLSMAAAFAQSPDPALLAEINSIRAIDNHSHPPKLVSPGEKDDEFDALPCDPLEPNDPPVAGRADQNPQVLAAYKALWGYKYNDMTPEHMKELLAAKQRVAAEQGDNYANWVLDRLGIDVEFANRIALGRGLKPPRFRWVPFDDALMLPLNNQHVAEENPDRRFFYSREEMLLKRYMKDSNVAAIPATLEEYLASVVTPTLERQKRDGAVAIKFEAAYLRTLDFEPASQTDASTIYNQFSRGTAPSKPEYLRLQDFLFHYIAREAGRLGLPVHIHTGAGCGGYFRLSGSNPLNLDAALTDPDLRKTNFVLIHGGWPFTKEMGFHLSRPNVYTDCSEMTWLISPRALSEVLRDWLEFYPEKVLFGTDLFPGPPELNWEEVGYVTTRTAREALAIALTGMMKDGEITRARASKLAHMVLRENAEKLYGAVASSQ